MILSASNKYFSHCLLLVLLISVLLVSGWLHSNNVQPAAQQEVSGLDGSSVDNSVIKSSKNNNINVFTPDWGVGATLVMLGHPPIAIGDKRIYPIWVDTPNLPAQVIDAGIRSQPNVELLAQLKPDFILDTFFYESSRSAYDPSTPVYDIDFGIKDNQSGQPKEWAPFIQATHKIGALLNEPELAQRYIDDSRQRIISAGQRIRPYIGDKKVLVVNFWDARQIRVATINSYPTLALMTMGIDVVKMDGGSIWGSTSVPMHKLFELPEDTCLIIAEPIPETLKHEITHSLLWQQSPFFRPDACIYIIDPVWSNGGIEVMLTFANNLEDAVVNSHSQINNAFNYQYIMGKAKTTEAAQ